jgi:hypothetical protein
MAVALNPADAPSWYDFITKFDATYASFYDNYNALMYLGPYIQNSHPELLSQYNAMLQAGAVNADQLEGLKATRDYVYSWLQWLETGAGDAAGFVGSAAQSAYDWAKRQLGLGEMGIIPVAVAVIGVSAAIAALVLIASWITDAYVFAQRLNALQAQEAKGLTPQQAADVVNQALGPPSAATSNFLGIPWALLIWGGIALVFGPPILRAITSGDRR